ncbi:hypothetical protein ACFE04_011959 [Oxalis oulophora]
MELSSSSSLQASFSFSIKPPLPFSSSSSSSTSNPIFNFPFLSHNKLSGFRMQLQRTCCLGGSVIRKEENSVVSSYYGEEKDDFFNNSTVVSNDEEKDSVEKGLLVDEKKKFRACDKLINVFMVDKPNPNEWRKLLAFSREWDNLRPYFYKRCQDRADSESDPGIKHNILRFSRKHKEIDDDMQRHNKLLKLIKDSPDLNEVVARRRKDFTKEFFVHLYTVAESYYDNPTEQNALAKLGNTCAAAVQAYDTTNESIESVNAAQLKLQDIMNSPSLDAACRKIDDLAEKNQLDSTLMLMITKAWSDTKESNMTKDEAKDTMYHLYKTARGNLQRMVPKEIRILKHLLMIEDHDELMCTLKDAFTPGEELEGEMEDSLFTTPEMLHASMQMVLDAYNYSQEGTLMREARDLMNPTVIQKTEELKKLVEKNFM